MREAQSSPDCSFQPEVPGGPQGQEQSCQMAREEGEPPGGSLCSLGDGCLPV